MKLYRFSPLWLRVLLLTVLVLGVFFRFVNLDRKAYWYDETVTSLRISGHAKREFTQQMANGQVRGLEDLRRYQRVDPEKSVMATIQSLAIRNPEHPPLYYVLARLWAGVMGNSVAAVRSLSAVIGLLALPCTYWVSRELFESPLVAWLATALVAISPFQVLYAQEAREYSLWTVAILFASAALLRAMRLGSRSGWGLYALALTVGLYTHLFSVFVACGHGLYVLLTSGLRLRKGLSAYLLASFVGVLAFVPWLVRLIKVRFDGLDWTELPVSLATLSSRWAVNLSLIFLDPQIGFQQPLFDVATGQDALRLGFENPWTYAIGLIVMLEVYAVYFLCRKAPRQAGWFVVLLIGVTASSLLIPDLTTGGQRSSIGRYLIPSYLGIQLAVAYWLGTQISRCAAEVRQQRGWSVRGWSVILAGLLAGGVLSCTISAQAQTWWNKYSSYYNPQVAAIINRATVPLVIGSNPLRVTSLSYQLDPKVKFLIVTDPELPAIPEGFSDIFLYCPSQVLQSGLERMQKYRLEPLHSPGCLWQLES